MRSESQSVEKLERPRWLNCCSLLPTDLTDQEISLSRLGKAPQLRSNGLTAGETAGETFHCDSYHSRDYFAAGWFHLVLLFPYGTISTSVSIISSRPCFIQGKLALL